jgi:hypothetical protein
MKMDCRQLLTAYCRGSNILREKLKEADDEMLMHLPDGEDAWTIKEHVIHLVDSEINGFIRLKSILAQPNTDCFVMDEETWTKNIRRKNEDVQKYLAVYGLIKDLVYDLLADEPEENWNRDSFIRNDKGERTEVTLEKGLEIYIDHLQAHMAYIDRNIADYNRKAQKG